MAVEIVMLLPGRASANVRMKAADCLERYAGGDLSMVQEVVANRLSQEHMDEDDSARPLGRQWKAFGNTSKNMPQWPQALGTRHEAARPRRTSA